MIKKFIKGLRGRKSPVDLLLFVHAVSVIASFIISIILEVFSSIHLLLLLPVLVNLIGFCIFLLISIFLGNRKWMIKLIGKFRRDLVPVELIDFSCCSYYSLANKNDNKLVACVYYMNRIGECILNKNGTVDSASESSYVYFWLPLDKSLAVEHVLSNDLPDFSNIKMLTTEEERREKLHFFRKIMS